MNAKIRRLSVVLLALFVLLFVQLNWWQVLRSDSLTADSRNNRATIRLFDKPRGPILTADGVVAAESVPVDPTEGDDRWTWQRRYPTGDLLSGITGYLTFGFGSTQIERTHADVLVGVTPAQRLLAAGSLFDDAPTTGTVHLTVRADLQRVAQRELAGRVGSVVVLDPRDGDVLAMYSNPTFDANLVATHDSGAAADEFERLEADPEKPLLMNAYRERYMPGSTFKILTTAIGLQSGALTPESTFPVERRWVPPDTDNPIRNYGGTRCGGDLVEVFRRSCNIAFARTAVTIGPEAMVAGVAEFGVEEPVPIDLPGAAASTFGARAEDLDDALALLAIHGFGQGSVQMVPLHMAMVAASVANDGVMMAPRVVAETRAADGTLLSRTQPRVWKTPMTAGTAALIRDYMVEVVRNGTASCCLRLAGGVQAAAKTGTAQLFDEGPERSHAWIVAFAPAERPRVAVAVMLKGVDDEISASTGGRLAGPIAKVLLDDALAVVQ
jgi:peptidoglycan glycosyltransferase